MEHLENLRIAVDFDGTIVEHEYPAIGKEMLFAFEALRELQKAGSLLILWTFRTGTELEEAVNFCTSRGIEFYAVNRNYPEEVFDENTPRKLNVDIFIDDRNVGGFPGWGEVWQTLSGYDDLELEVRKQIGRKRGLIGRLFGSLFK